MKKKLSLSKADIHLLYLITEIHLHNLKQLGSEPGEWDRMVEDMIEKLKILDNPES